MATKQPEVTSYLRFEIIDPKYLHIHVHIAYVFWAHFEGLLEASEATAATPKVKMVACRLNGLNR